MFIIDVVFIFFFIVYIVIYIIIVVIFFVYLRGSLCSNGYSEQYNGNMVVYGQIFVNIYGEI